MTPTPSGPARKRARELKGDSGSVAADERGELLRDGGRQ